MVHATVYRTVTNGLRRVGVVATGVVVGAASQERYLAGYVVATAVGSGGGDGTPKREPMRRREPGGSDCASWLWRKHGSTGSHHCVFDGFAVICVV